MENDLIRRQDTFKQIANNHPEYVATMRLVFEEAVSAGTPCDWVSVKKGLPETTGMYLVTLKGIDSDGDPYYCTADAWFDPSRHPFTKSGWTLLNEFYPMSEEIKDDITHWMPYPAPCEEDS